MKNLFKKSCCALTAFVSSFAALAAEGDPPATVEAAFTSVSTMVKGLIDEAVKFFSGLYTPAVILAAVGLGFFFIWWVVGLVRKSGKKG